MHLVTTTELYDNSRTLLDSHGGFFVDKVSPKRDWKRLKRISGAGGRSMYHDVPSLDHYRFLHQWLVSEGLLVLGKAGTVVAP